jgi:hypothetical protein
MLLSYRRFLGDWVSGRLRMTLGVDLGLSDLTKSPTMFGAAMVGAQARIGGWGGSRYGGVSVRVETGFGFGQYALRPAAPGEAGGTASAPAWVLQVGPRAEFLIKTSTREMALPVSLGLALRFVQPLDPDARTLHDLVRPEAQQEIVGTASFAF